MLVHDMVATKGQLYEVATFETTLPAFVYSHLQHVGVVANASTIVRSGLALRACPRRALFARANTVVQASGRREIASAVRVCTIGPVPVVLLDHSFEVPFNKFRTQEDQHGGQWNWFATTLGREKEILGKSMFEVVNETVLAVAMRATATYPVLLGSILPAHDTLIMCGGRRIALGIVLPSPLPTHPIG